MARWPVAFALLALLACTRSGTGTGSGKGGPTDRLLNRDWEALCLQPTTPSCGPYVRRLPSAGLGECCRVKCRAGDAESCQAYLELHPVTTVEFWNWPKVKELPWRERLGVTAPAELVEYLSLRADGSLAEPAPAAADADADLKRDLLLAWKELPASEREDGARLLIGVSAVKELGAPVREVLVRQAGKAVGGFLALDWGTTLKPVNEWAKRPLAPSAKNTRQATLGWLLRIGIARVAGRSEPKP